MVSPQLKVLLQYTLWCADLMFSTDKVFVHPPDWTGGGVVYLVVFAYE